MNNFCKPGYSVPEVAQIIGRTPATIRAWIDKGLIGSYRSSDTTEKGRKRSLRIGREHLADFIYAHQLEFDPELVNVFLKYRSGYPKPDERNDIVDGTSGTSVPTGAWAHLIEDGLAEETDIKTPEMTEAEPQAKAYILNVNGRLAVGNITADTAKKILSALLEDEICHVDSVEIRCFKKEG